MELEEWAQEQAAQVVSDVERHGVAITWGEAYGRLLDGARFLGLPVSVDQGGGEYVRLEPTGDGKARYRPDVAEEVACSVVHYEGKAFFPRDPAKSRTGIAVPWDIASELVARLSFLLCVRLGKARCMPEIESLNGLAGLVVSLSSRVADEMGWIGDDDIVDDDKIEGRRYLLMSAREVWLAARFLSDAPALIPDDATVVAPLNQGLIDGLADVEARDTLLWDMERWITDRTGA